MCPALRIFLVTLGWKTSDLKPREQRTDGIIPPNTRKWPQKHHKEWNNPERIIKKDSLPISSSLWRSVANNEEHQILKYLEMKADVLKTMGADFSVPLFLSLLQGPMVSPLGESPDLCRLNQPYTLKPPDAGKGADKNV